jgi:hypothetical protein
MAYTTINKSTDYFNTKLYTGNGGTNAITGVGFQPDMVWIKDRTGTNNHEITDVVRGVNYQIYPNLNNAQTNAANHLTTFGTDGFTVGSDGSTNTNSSNYVSWNWKASGSTASNTDGSITSTVSANTTSGFSIVKWTGTGANGTVGHGLNAVPKMIIVKDTDASDNWNVYHVSTGNDSHLHLNLNLAASGSSTYWQDYTPTSSVFYIGSDSAINASGNEFIAYCFAEKTGYSKFSSYKGNGNSDGPFIYTGFKPAFLLSKRSTSTTMDWHIWDNKRSGAGGFNVLDKVIYPNHNLAEDTLTSLDFVSNGVKIRDNRNFLNTSGETYVYMAFGQSLVGSNNVPCTAR